MTKTLHLPGVLTRIEPQDGALPLFFDSPHSGAHYPDDFDHVVPLEILRTAEDPFVDEFYLDAPDYGATFLAAHFPRSYIDVNRAHNEIDEALLDGPWPQPVERSAKLAYGMGLIRASAVPGMPLYDRKLSIAEVHTRIERYWRPYHHHFTEIYEGLRTRFGAVWHINCHSMWSQGNAMTPDGKPRPDFCIGDYRGETASIAFTQFVRGFLADHGYDVRVNDPFDGAYLTTSRASPRERRESLLLEMNRKLYIDDPNPVKHAGFARMLTLMQDLQRALADFVRQRV